MRVVLADLSMRGARHGPFNALLLHLARLALGPGRPIEFWAESSHAAAVAGLLDAPDPATEFRHLTLSEHHPDQDELVSARRLWHDVATLLRVLRAEKARADTLLVVSSLSATGVAAAWVAQRLLGRRRLAVQCVLHGNLASIRKTWRPRNPVFRALQLRPVLRRTAGPSFRFLVLEETIAAALRVELPGIAAFVDVLPHPASPREVSGPSRPAAVPRIGMLGLVTRSKGAEAYVRLAAASRGERPGRLRFAIAGRLHADLATLPLDGIDELPQPGEMDRAAFVARVQSLDFVCLPYAGGYYELAASGSLLDAIACCRPLISLRGPLVDGLFMEFGDIGHLCDDEAAMLAELTKLANGVDPARYARQVAAMARLRDARMPERLAPRYRAILAAMEVR